MERGLEINNFTSIFKEKVILSVVLGGYKSNCTMPFWSNILVIFECVDRSYVYPYTIRTSFLVSCTGDPSWFVNFSCKIIMRENKKNAFQLEYSRLNVPYNEICLRKQCISILVCSVPTFLLIPSYTCVYAALLASRRFVSWWLTPPLPLHQSWWVFRIHQSIYKIINITYIHYRISTA